MRSKEAAVDSTVPAPVRWTSFVGVVGSWYLAACVCVAAMAPPSTSTTARWALAASGVASIVTIAAGTRRWWRAMVADHALALAAASILVLTIVALFFGSFGSFWLSLPIAVVVYLVFIPVAIVLLGVAIARATRRPAQAAFVILVLGLFGSVLWFAVAPIEDAGLRFRINRVAPVYEREATARSTEMNRPDRHDRFFGVAPDGRTTVAWEWAEGIPARSYGPMYDPSGALGNGSGVFSAGNYDWSSGRCRRIDRAWYWCQVY